MLSDAPARFQGRRFGFFGEPRVNVVVLLLDIAHDSAFKK
jgi:K+-transporting ATPase c subunit